MDDSTLDGQQATDANGSTPMNGDDVEPQGISNLLFKHHGVRARDTAPTQKRKTPTLGEEINDDDDEVTTKKAKTTFNGTANGGTLSNHMKAERERFAATSEPNAEPIDLTKDDDDEIVFVGQSKLEESREVCLGKLSARAAIWKIPRGSRSNMSSVPKDFWPGARVYHRRMNNQGVSVDLLDRDPSTTTLATAFGKLEHLCAAALCPLLDGSVQNKIRIKMFLEPFKRQNGEVEGGHVSRSVNLTIIIFSPYSKAQGIGTHLSQRQLFLSAPPPIANRLEYYNPQQPPDYGPGKVAKNLGRGSSHAMYGVARTEEDMRRETESVLDKLFQRGELPEMEPDTSIITTPLMAHQKQGVWFMVQHERREQDAAEGEVDYSLWKPHMTPKGEVWRNIVTNHELTEKPDAMRGGILADMMGLGKTLTVVAVHDVTKDEAREFGKQDPPAHMENVVRNAKATLVICPKSVLANWDEQIKAHAAKNRFRVYTYHGPSRTQDLDELAKCNYVLTTYSTAAAEFSDKSQRRNALASIHWFRIVLDEAHQIRTQNTQFFQSCRALEAQRRWAVTGTPVQNRLDDMGALVKFLRLKPFDEGNAWAQHIMAPFKSRSEHAENHLHLIVEGITLRRLKDKIGFTERHEKIVRLDFSEAELLDYKLFSTTSNRQLKMMISTDGLLKGTSYAHILKALLRLRSYCAHGREMLNENDMKELEGLTITTAIDLGDEPDEEDGSGYDGFISEKNAYESLDMMMDSENCLCIRCGRKVDVEEDVPEDDDSDSPGSPGKSGDDERPVDEDVDDTIAYLTPCYHIVCPECKEEHINTTRPKLTDDHYHDCVYCESYVRFGLFQYRRSTLNNIQEARRKRNSKEKRVWNESNYSGPSTKVKALIDDLMKSELQTAELPSHEDPIRSVVFSGWTTYLDLISHALDENGIPHVRLDGKMSLKARARVMEEFKSNPSIAVMIVSIKAGGQGLNFTAASKVYMMEPQFNPGVEQQAIDRVHRLGQKRDVEITHFLMSDSIEESVLELQKKKMALATLSLERKKGTVGEERKRRMEELSELFK